MELRPYQHQALDAIEKGWDEFRRQLLVLPTGTGKTIVFSHLAARESSRGRHTLILAHRDELLQQAQEKLKAATGLSSALEKADSRAYELFGDGLFATKPHVVVGSVQTLGNGRLTRWPKDTFDLVVVDEAHHVLSDSYRRIVDHFDGARMLGVTATPDRGDKKSLGAVFENIAFEYPMPLAIREKYLAPIRAKLLPLRIDLGAVRTTAGDYNAADLDAGIEPYSSGSPRRSPRMSAIVRRSSSCHWCGPPRCLPHCCGAGHPRRARGRRFARPRGHPRAVRPRRVPGVVQLLLLEGYDCPDIACIVCLRPTKVRSLYQQMIGRGTRIAPGKDDLLILDFLWQSTEHSLCVPATLFARSDEECRQMMDLVAQGVGGGGEVDLLDAQADAQKSREETLARRLREQIRKKARMLDPIEYALSLHDDDLMEYEPTMPWHFLEVTEKQRTSLQKFARPQHGHVPGPRQRR